MDKLTICPHCGEEITKEDFANDALFKQFCKTEACKNVEKKADLWFFFGALLIFVMFFTYMFYGSELSLNSLVITLCGAVVGLVIMAIGWRRYDSVKDKLFQEFKKFRE